MDKYTRWCVHGWLVAAWHDSWTIGRIFKRRAHHGINTQCMQSPRTRMYMENPTHTYHGEPPWCTVYISWCNPRVVIYGASHDMFHGESHGLILPLSPIMGHAVVYSIWPNHGIDHGSVRGVNHDTADNRGVYPWMDSPVNYP